MPTDKAYSSRAIREHLRRRRVRAVIPRPAFDREAYKKRNAVERCINKLKQRRGLAIRYDKIGCSAKAVD